ncbi:MAG: bifunctional histidinol-phosphatase/imidazoleglycerol-phosphate dehydratase [Flavobacteriaceae bacterium]|nr:bifunctional histidinol-phosphatase/imidazoleglycerol-phosphate dehydratase [Flavobacteriaceae bacterium]
MKKILFIDRDGTLINEPKDFQVDSFEKLEFKKSVLKYLSKISEELDFDLVMVTNQDGLGTKSFPEKEFWPVQNFIIKTLQNEGIYFKEILIDRTFPDENANTRKPNTGLIEKYLVDKNININESFVIGDRLTDLKFAQNIGCKGILINDLKTTDHLKSGSNIDEDSMFSFQDWKSIYNFLKLEFRTISFTRKTNETNIKISLNLDGTGNSSIDTGIKFFDHMLDQLCKHSGIDINLSVKGDLDVDEHHTIEDTAIALGKGFKRVLKDKMGIERYGFCLPMDDSLATVSLDFGGRSWLVWDVSFKREMIGKMPTEMFIHFFKSFSDESKSNLNIKAVGDNEHHKIESIFKAFAKAIKMAVKRDPDKMVLPTTKGIL